MSEPRLRIEDLVLMDPAEVGANPLNWRTHSPDQEDALKAAWQNVGIVGAAVYNRRTGHLIDGHLRREMAAKAGVKLPVVVVDLDEDEERLALATFDPIGAMAGTNATALDALLSSLAGTAGLDDVLSDIAADAGLYAGAFADDEGADLPTEPAEPADDARHALAIVLTNAEKRRWDAVKAGLGVEGDKTAFLRLVADAEGGS